MKKVSSSACSSVFFLETTTVFQYVTEMLYGSFSFHHTEYFLRYTQEWRYNKNCNFAASSRTFSSATDVLETTTVW